MDVVPQPHVRLSLHPLVTPVLLGLLGLSLRLYGLTQESLWIDESATLRRASLPVGMLLENSARHGQLPLYYLLMHLWLSGAGTGEAALRLPSALLGGLNVLLTYLVLGRLQSDPPGSRIIVAERSTSRAGRGAERSSGPDPGTPPPSGPGLAWSGRQLTWAHVGAVLVATQPVLIYFGQEARTYTLLLALTWALVLTLLVPLHHRRSANSREHLGLATALGLMAFCHYLGWVMGLAALLVHFWHLRDRRKAGAGSRAQGWYLPPAAYLLALGSWTAYLAWTGYWPDSAFHQSSTLSETLRSWSAKGFAPALLLQIPLLLALIKGLRALEREAPVTARTCLLGLLGLPLTVFSAGALTTNYFSARYLLPIMVPGVLLASRGLLVEGHSGGKGQRERRLLLVIILVLALTQTAWQSQTPLKPQWREAARIIEGQLEPGEVVAVAPRWERETLGYYLPGTSPQGSDQLQQHLERGENETDPLGLWVVYRSDRDAERRELEVELEGRYEWTRVADLKSLQVWHYQAL